MSDYHEHNSSPMASRYDLRARRVVLIMLVWLASAVVIDFNFKIVSYLDRQLSEPFLFHARELVDRGPYQTDKLKVFVYDDRAYALTQRPALEFKEWCTLVNALSQQSPKRVIIDSLFSADPGSTEIIQNMCKRDSWKNVATGAFLSRHSLAGRRQIDPSLNLKNFIEGKDFAIPSEKLTETERPFVYGSHEKLQNLVKITGHLHLFQDHAVSPHLTLPDQIHVPHLSLYAADRLKFESAFLSVNQSRISLNEAHSLLVNFIHPKRVVFKSLAEFFEANGLSPNQRASNLFAHITPEDTVLFLPLYYTGNTDFRPSPFGLIPGGHYLVSMVNSVLTNQWLRFLPLKELQLFLGLLLIGILAVLCSVRVYLAGVIAFFASILITTSVLFAFYGFYWGWFAPLTLTGLIALHLLTIKVRNAEVKELMLRSALDGAMDPKLIEEVLANPRDKIFEPRERIVTIMFIDVAGYSFAASHLTPRMAFEALQGLLNDLRTIVHQYGGVVDRSIGDGLLCYFGHDFNVQNQNIDHATTTLECAIAVQLYSIDSFAASNHIKTKNPLRIGINTATCFIGNLGSTDRVDISIIGSGVNLAKRLESASPHCGILIGRSTAQLLNRSKFSHCRFIETAIDVKHFKEKTEASDVDFYSSDPILDRKRRELLDSYQSLIESGTAVTLDTQNGEV